MLCCVCQGASLGMVEGGNGVVGGAGGGCGLRKMRAIRLATVRRRSVRGGERREDWSALIVERAEQRVLVLWKSFGPAGASFEMWDPGGASSLRNELPSCREASEDEERKRKITTWTTFGGLIRDDHLIRAARVGCIGPFRQVLCGNPYNFHLIEWRSDCKVYRGSGCFLDNKKLGKLFKNGVPIIPWTDNKEPGKLCFLKTGFQLYLGQVSENALCATK